MCAIYEDEVRGEDYGAKDEILFGKSAEYNCENSCNANENAKSLKCSQ